MTSKDVYDEVRFDLTTESIRLVQIIYANRQDGSYIQLKLQNFPLVSSPPYYALSYVWGQPSHSKKVIVNGKYLEIRKNLWHFLWKASIPEGCKYLWIDALCINQKNVEERNHQVKIMGDIYKNVRGHNNVFESTLTVIVRLHVYLRGLEKLAVVVALFLITQTSLKDTSIQTWMDTSNDTKSTCTLKDLLPSGILSWTVSLSFSNSSSENIGSECG
jgi:hypothetical protein